MNKVKRIAAIVGIVLIVSMYLVTLVSSFFINKYTKELFYASLFSTFVVPVMIYAYMMIYKLVHKTDNTVNLEKLPHLGDIQPSDKQEDSNR